MLKKEEQALKSARAMPPGNPQDNLDHASPGEPAAIRVATMAPFQTAGTEAGSPKTGHYVFAWTYRLAHRGQPRIRDQHRAISRHGAVFKAGARAPRPRGLQRSPRAATGPRRARSFFPYGLTIRKAPGATSSCWATTCSPRPRRRWFWNSGRLGETIIKHDVFLRGSPCLLGVLRAT